MNLYMIKYKIHTYVRTLVDSVLSRQTPADSRGQRQSLNRHGTHLHTHKWTHGQKTEEQVNMYTMLCTYAFSYGIGFKNYISISNKALYKRTHSEPISTMALYARWKLFGHILRLPPNVPANKAMIAYFSQHGTGRRGRPRTTLPIVLNDDLKGTPYKLKSKKDLELLRTKAQARGEWNNLIELVAKT